MPEATPPAETPPTDYPSSWLPKTHARPTTLAALLGTDNQEN